MSSFMFFCAFLLGYFGVAGAKPYREWVPVDDVVDQRRMEIASFGLVALAVTLAFIGGRLS